MFTYYFNEFLVIKYKLKIFKKKVFNKKYINI